MWTNNGPARWLTEDKSTVVPDGDARARFLLVAAGAQLPIAEAAQYGLTNDQGSTAPATDEPTDAKAKPAAPENKLKAAPTNKAK